MQAFVLRDQPTDGQIAQSAGGDTPSGSSSDGLALCGLGVVGSDGDNYT